MPQSHLLYVSMDEAMGTLGCAIADVVQGYERFLAKNLETLVNDERVFLFIDEAHYDPRWSLTLKTVYDRTRNVFIFVTGSSAVSLTTGTDVARRAKAEKLFPMSYPEYNLLRDRTPPPGIDDALGSALYDSSSAREAFDRISEIYQTANDYLSKVKPMQLNGYLKLGSLPFAIPFKDEQDVYERISSMLEKAVYQDLGSIGEFDRGTQVKTMNLLTLLAANDRINLSKLASDLGLSKPTLVECISALEKADLIFRVWPRGSSSARIRKTPKYKFTAPAVRVAILWNVGQVTTTGELYGALLEDAVAMYLHKATVGKKVRGFEFDPDDSSADFIVTAGDGSCIVIEVGYGHKGTEQVRNSAAHCEPKYGIIVSDDRLELLSEESVLVMPRELFLLS